MPKGNDKFRSESGTSKTAGVALIRFQQDQWLLAWYLGKKLPQAV